MSPDVPRPAESIEAKASRSLHPGNAAEARVQPVLGPVSSQERLDSVDVLRGFALLGILVMNIVSFGLPDAAYNTPTVAGGFTGANFACWLFAYVFFDLKMMTIFSLLFGAGLILMTERAEARVGSLRGIYYRRIVWLIVFGLVHAYVLWYGDILFMYGVCGLLLYLFRRRSPRFLLILGSFLVFMVVPLNFGFGTLLESWREAAREDNASPAARMWSGIRSSFQPGEEEVAEELAKYRGSFWQSFEHNAGVAFALQIFLLPFFGLWRVGGLMLLGMAFMKLQLFSARRSPRLYWWLVRLGYGIGIPVVGCGAWLEVAHGFDFVYNVRWGNNFNYIGSLFVAAGHIGAVMLACQVRLLPRLAHRLAAVGRMALTNYLMHSLVCTIFFRGWGFGWFGYLERWQLLGVVLAIWFVQLVLSPLWLRRFRFGPMEWLWRSLTYRARQPMLVG
jgi:uncharacterized protein